MWNMLDEDNTSMGLFRAGGEETATCLTISHMTDDPGSVHAAGDWEGPTRFDKTVVQQAGLTRDK